MNKIILHGRLTKDPELKVTTGDHKVSTFSIAVNRKFEKEKTDFFNCEAWNKTAEIINQYLKKGDGVIVIGSMQSRKHEEKTYWNVKVDEFDFAEKKKSETSQPSFDDLEAAF